MEVSDQLYAPADLTPKKEVTGVTVWWIPNVARRFGEQKNLLLSAGIEQVFFSSPVRSLVIPDHFV
jgi:hypothetical protein